MKKHLITWFGLVMAACLLLSLVLTGCANTAAVSNPAPNPVVASLPAAVPDTTTPAAPAKGPREGIKVHGHWTIEVTNPDGTVASHTEFENAIHYMGSKALCDILARNCSVGGWLIRLYGPNGGSPWGLTANNGDIFESTFPDSWPFISKNLSVVSTNGTLILNGTINAGYDGVIDSVMTGNFVLNNTSPPSSAYANLYNYITATSLDKVVTLKAGQQIAVTVTISFS